MAEAREAYEKWQRGVQRNQQYEYAQHDEAMQKLAKFRQNAKTFVAADKAKEREKIELQREKKRLREEAAEAAAKAAAEAARARKVLVSGDARGGLARLFATVEAQAAKVGPFDALLCVGALLPDASSADDAGALASAGAYLGGERGPPVATYFIDAGAALLHAAPEGRQLGENLHFLGAYGIREISGLRVAYLSGRYDPQLYETGDVDFVGGAFTCRAVRNLIALVDSCEQKSVDMLLTCGWPAGLVAAMQEGTLRPTDAGAPPLTELCLALEPRYHIFGTGDVFHQHAPFKVRRGSHYCRCIGLGRLGSTGKERKWMHALKLSPMAHMKPEDLCQVPDNAAQSPFQAVEDTCAGSAASSASASNAPSISASKRGEGEAEDEAAPPAKRQRSEGGGQDAPGSSESAQRALAALLAGNAAEYQEVLSSLETLRCTLPLPDALAKAESAVDTSAASPDASDAGGAAGKAAPAAEEESEADKAAKQRLRRKPPKGCVRYTFEMWGPIGLRLSKDVPPWILEVKDGSLAARKAPRMPLGGIIVAVNGHELDHPASAELVPKALAARPVVLDVQWPRDQGLPSSMYA
eukprot:TRINITY_DN40833_c0_g1_i1.p1 TRINITY_DN40833_c0_g1~~TRINITY_DN40833_c0_g1_i1.p1  ORF type:complete len:608 (-),score=141.79 TRINITY_DN40833_c0_g1_i1:73-1821(-)